MPITAKGMFDDLGYECDDSDKHYIEYKKYFDVVDAIFIISFDLLSNECGFRFEEESESMRLSINAKELEAIVKQTKELGWDK